MTTTNSAGTATIQTNNTNNSKEITTSKSTSLPETQLPIAKQFVHAKQYEISNLSTWLNFFIEQETVYAKGARKKKKEINYPKIKEVGEEWKEKKQKLQRLEEERNKNKDLPKEEAISRGREIKEDIKLLTLSLNNLEETLTSLLMQIPNAPLPEVPEGNESGFELLKEEGKPKQFNFEPKDHQEIGKILDIIEIERAAKVSGSRFAYLKNEGVLLELALVQFAIDTLMMEGFIPIFPPALIKQEITQGLGYWQGGGNDNYYLVNDYEEKDANTPNPLYLIGTAEHSIVPMHSEETFMEKELPKRYAGFSPAFRREAGSYGKDTRGILRVHQFDKVEMVSFVKPEDDENERKKLLSLAEKFMSELGLPYRVVRLASEDISFPAAETIDIETWIPSENKYRETHSISTTTDFQSRRLNIKYKYLAEFEGGKPAGIEVSKYVHILNGTAFAIGRTLVAILENNQEEDGSVIIPEVLRKYIPGNPSKITPKKI